MGVVPDTLPRPDRMSIARPATSAAIPVASHFSCWLASDATKHTATSTKIPVSAAFHHVAAGSSPLSRYNCPAESTCGWWPMTAPTVMAAVQVIHTRLIPA
jgi:hypothetical protein